MPARAGRSLRRSTDRALSGASRFRPAFQQMRVDAEARRFDVIIVEALDRMSRKLADVADLHDLLSYLGIKLVTLSTGEVTALHIGMLGTLAQLTLSDLREKTARSAGSGAEGQDPRRQRLRLRRRRAAPKGARGAHQPGRSGGVVRDLRGVRRRREPARDREAAERRSVPGPGGRPGGDTTIRGQADRGTGILNNALYVGRLDGTAART